MAALRASLGARASPERTRPPLDLRPRPPPAGRRRQRRRSAAGAPAQAAERRLAQFPARLYIVRHGESAGNLARDGRRAAGSDASTSPSATWTCRSARAARRRRAPSGAGSRPCRQRAADGGADLALPARAATRRGSSARRAASPRHPAVADRRAAARAGVRRSRPPDQPRASRPSSRSRRRRARRARQVLSPAAGRRELVRRDPAAAQRDEHPRPAPRRAAGADRLPPGGRALLALPAGEPDRGRDPGHRPARPTSPTARLPNTSRTLPEPIGMRLVRYNVTAPLTDQDAPVTTAPDANIAPR